MYTIDEISTTKIKDVDITRLKIWIQDEVYSTADDFGQKLDDEQAKHIGSRLYYVLTTKYKNWEVGIIHSIFQKGISGQYGKTASKVTVSNILNWLISEEKLKHTENGTVGFQIEEITDSKRFDVNMNKHMKFIRWCQEKNIDVSQLDEIDTNMLSDHYYHDSLKITKLREKYNQSTEAEMELLLPTLPIMRDYGTVKQLIKKNY